jgi:hypothetical protein
MDSTRATSALMTVVGGFGGIVGFSSELMERR